MGEVLKVGKHDLTVQTREPLSNGDGLNVLIKREVVGFRASVVEPLKQFEEDGQPFWQYRVEPNEMPAAMRQVRPNHPLNRNLDHNWQNALLKTSAERRIGVRWLAKLRADELELHVTSEEGAYATTLPGPGEAKKPEQVPGQIADLLSQLGTTLYHAEEVEVDAPQAFFIPNSQLKALRREAIEALTEAREAIRPRGGASRSACRRRSIQNRTCRFSTTSTTRRRAPSITAMACS